MLRAVLALLASVVAWSALSFALIPAQRANADADGVSTAALALDRGRHLAQVVGCTSCHGANLGGAKVYGDPAQLVLWAPNLTSGAGGILAYQSAADFARAVRRGIGPDGKKLLVMPSWNYAAFTDADLASIYAYVRSVPPVERQTPPVKFGKTARAAFASGEIRYDANELSRTTLPAFDATPIVKPAYGAYLARIAGCETCHGVHLGDE